MTAVSDKPTKRGPGREKGCAPHNAKTLAEHIRDGTYHATRHKPPALPLTLVKPKLRSLPSKRDSMKYVRCEADERAIANGCRFSVELADYFLGWAKKYIRLSEGIWAGKPFVPLDWQRDELFYPLFGWVRKHPDHGLICRRINRVYCEVPKKNGKSPTGALIGTYMLCGDGERGGKVFSAATSKEQASIVHTHAVNMVHDSPELQALCKINHTTKHIVYQPLRSVYSVLSAIAATQEGLNASCIVADEIHVWKGDSLFNALRYAFRSRLEPIFFQITTAGDDMQSVCRLQHDYAAGVIAGDIDDEGFLGLIYAADVADDWADEKTWEKANPSIDKIVMRSDLRRDVAEAKCSQRLISSFKRYTLNIWATAESPWLNMDAWSRCRREYDEDDLLGQLCYGALDLSMSRDLTAFTLLFPEDDGSYRQLVYYWMPEDTARDRAHLGDYRGWVQHGYLETTPGNEIDYAFVKKRIVEASEKFDMKELAYDRYYATAFTQGLQEEHGIERVEFIQGMRSFAEPTAEYERLVGRGEMHHNGHPILTWQASHCMVKSDENKNIRPVKRKHGDYRTIDGIVTGVMALGRALLAEKEEENVYATRGFVRL